MKKLTFALVAIGILAACSPSTTQAPDVAGQIRKALDQPAFRDVSVSQDRDKGVVTLSGDVDSEAYKAQAESIAKSIAVGQVVAAQIAVRPPGSERDAKAIDSNLDDGIEKNLEAALIKNKLQRDVKYDAKQAVVTLTGTVDSQAKRARVEQVAAAVPNVRQVINELQVSGQKATSSQ